MAKSNAPKIELTAYDDLFQTDESRAEARLSKIRDIPISEIDEFPDHPYVCWYCKNGTDYFWGYYCNELSSAREKLNERYKTECNMPYNQPPKKQRQHNDRER